MIFYKKVRSNSRGARKKTQRKYEKHENDEDERRSNNNNSVRWKTNELSIDFNALLCNTKQHKSR